jgi:hypothetical protein
MTDRALDCFTWWGVGSGGPELLVVTLLPTALHENGLLLQISVPEPVPQEAQRDGGGMPQGVSIKVLSDWREIKDLKQRCESEPQLEEEAIPSQGRRGALGEDAPKAPEEALRYSKEDTELHMRIKGDPSESHLVEAIETQQGEQSEDERGQKRGVGLEKNAMECPPQ